MISQRDTYTLLILRKVIGDSDRCDMLEKQGKEIKSLDARPFLLGLQSAEAYITRALYKADKPLHLGELMDQIEALGWKSDSRYHKYGYIGKVLRDNYYMFKRVAPATWALRKAFAPELSEPKSEKPKEWSKKPIPTIKDVLKTFVDHYNPSNTTELHQMLRYVGYDNISLTTVKDSVGDMLTKPTK